MNTNRRFGVKKLLQIEDSKAMHTIEPFAIRTQCVALKMKRRIECDKNIRTLESETNTLGLTHTKSAFVSFTHFKQNTHTQANSVDDTIPLLFPPPFSLLRYIMPMN